MMSVPVMSDGIRSGVNWMRLNSRPSVCAMVRTSSVLAVPGMPGDQAVAAHEQGDQHLFEHLVLADDHLAHLLHNRRLHGLEASHLGPEIFNVCLNHGYYFFFSSGSGLFNSSSSLWAGR